MKTIVFSDIDGTLLHSDHQMSVATKEAILSLQAKDIPFVIVSARSPSGIYPILKKNDFTCAIIAYSGGLILNEAHQVIASQGFAISYAKEMIAFMKEQGFDLTANIYSGDDWIVEKRDERVLREEHIVEAKARVASFDDLNDDMSVNKILCMCNPDYTNDIEKALKERFKDVVISKSSDILIEINALGITKAHAVEMLCDYYHCPIDQAIAFGDNYNDLSMLEAVGHPYLMANAPQALLEKLPTHTLSNDEDGLVYALKQLQLIDG